MCCTISAEDAVLISAHFDSAIGSPGASDDGAQVAVALEVARLLATGAWAPTLPRAVILLFNGAEEFNWLAAHGFITDMEAPLEVQAAPAAPHAASAASSPAPSTRIANTWSKSVRAMVNLEAIGSGGRPALMRTTPGAGWMTRAFGAAVPRPRATVVADDILNAKVFPGDTDLRAVRDFGPGIAGVDLIFIEHGHAYHTPQDTAARVRRQDLALMGGQLFSFSLQLLRTLADTGGGMGDIDAEEQVYFDVLGLFLVGYSRTVGEAINLAAACAGLVVWAHAMPTLSLKQLIQRLCSDLAQGVWALLSPALVGAGVGVVVNLSSPLAWYSNTWLCFFLYLPPAVLATLLASTGTGRMGRGGMEVRDPSVALVRGVRGNLALLSLVLALLTVQGLRSAYVILVWVLSGLLFLALTGVMGARCSASARGTAVMFTACMAPATIYWLQVARTVLVIFLPVMGRAGMLLRPDIFIGALVGFLTACTAMLPSTLLRVAPPSFSRLTRSLLIILVAVTAAAIAYAVLAAGPAAPYSPERPKRLFVQQIERLFHDANDAETSRESHLWINAHDILALQPLAEYGKVAGGAWGTQWASARAYQCARTSGAACSLPWFFPLADIILHGWLLPAPPPPIPAHLDLRVALDRRQLAFTRSRGGGQGRRVDVEVTGPSAVGVIVRDPAKLVVDWSFGESGSDGIDPAEQRRENKLGFAHKDGSYFIYMVAGGADMVDSSRRWRFWLVVRGDERVEADIYGHYFRYGSAESPDNSGCAFSKETKELSGALPQWASPVCFFDRLHQYQL